MRLCIILACWLYSALITAAPLRVGLEKHDYYPYFKAVEGQAFEGYCIALLQAFAKHQGLQLELRPQPVNRLYRNMLGEHSLDLLFPDNPAWSRQARDGQPLYYSQAVVEIVDATLVRREHLGQGLQAIKRIGIVRGFTAEAWQTQLPKYAIELIEVQDIQSMIRMLERGRLDALYANPKVVEHHMQLLDIPPASIQQDPQLPQITTHFHLSSYQHPELIKDFDRFLTEQAPQLKQLQQRFNLP
ncbi:peptidase M24 [Pseudomonas sp. HMWF032]|uniref:substrate-binding periplasmic protein n=1 Tax=unclassified Pseudomonas TaxID=196821 RepID=UPI000D38577F|nr:MULTISPECIES: transporter substrate-binding domain-containing protein [unclassified Pseudomonas]PTS84781.1 peptidase M24 [Pseudomonas sp. HMWF032]PTT80951.1 peptidase M24 [Pseudomonas sp. HMWF010]WAC46223.1 transporter substrate-binding domain-containing protein [Pseudomonas sp. SL4(2022)]